MRNVFKKLLTELLARKKKNKLDEIRNWKHRPE